jgi:hypothetical protein
VRESPAGILTLGALLAMAGAGLLAAGAYAALAGIAGWPSWVATLVVAPLMIYVAGRLVQRVRWAYLVMCVLLLLLIASSALRLATEPWPAVAPLAELAAELGCAAYLARPRVRASFQAR